MIVAVAVVRMMQPALDEIIHVVTVRYGRMSAIRSMNMTCLVAGGTVGALVWVGRVHCHHVFVYVVTMHVMEMPVV